jgi:hypothetical protein
MVAPNLNIASPLPIAIGTSPKERELINNIK